MILYIQGTIFLYDGYFYVYVCLFYKKWKYFLRVELLKNLDSREVKPVWFLNKKLWWSPQYSRSLVYTVQCIYSLDSSGFIPKSLSLIIQAGWERPDSSI